MAEVFAGFDNQRARGWHWFVRYRRRWWKAHRWYASHERAKKAGERKLAQLRGIWATAAP